jgi:outer membrane lipoprotein-sorting protein
MLRRLGLVLALLVSFALPAVARDNPHDLVKRVETQYQARTAHIRMKMTVVTRTYTREMTLESWGEGRDKFLARVLSPKKDAGTATLKVGDEIWNYLPKIDRLVKVPSSLMGDRWMGSHLTNDDLVKGRKVDDLYTFRETEAVVAGGSQQIIATPKPNAPVVWGQIDYVIDTRRGVPESVQYYDEDHQLVRTITFSEVKRLNGREVATRMRVTPADAPQEYTQIDYETLEFDVPLRADQFSLRSLRR